MNAMNHEATKNYQKVQIESASPEKLVLMLFDGAVRKLGTAETSFQAGDFEIFHENVVRVQKILTELLGALDTSKGGDLAENLERLYDYMLRQLSLSIVRRNLEQVTEVKNLLSELREGWQGVVQQKSAGEDEVTPPVPADSQVKSSGPPDAYSAEPERVSSLNISG